MNLTGAEGSAGLSMTPSIYSLLFHFRHIYTTSVVYPYKRLQVLLQQFSHYLFQSKMMNTDSHRHHV